jgi:type IV pilus assembly protein PilC
MEFRCRLGTPGGEIIEGVYVAESEARLRREFEEKGLYVLGMQRAGRIALGGLALPRRSRVATREFLIFNQELATLLKAGMPLVQSLDILRRRISQPLFKSVLDDVYERVRGGNALSEAFEAHGALQEMLNSLADFFDEEIETSLGRFVTLIEPTLLVIMGLVIAGLLLSLYMPLFNMSDALR